MKITLNLNEAKALKNIMETVEEGSCGELLESLKGNNIIACNVDINAQTVTINVDEDYTEEMLFAYEEFINVFIRKATSLFKITFAFAEKTDKIVEKYNSKGGEVNA